MNVIKNIAIVLFLFSILIYPLSQLYLLTSEISGKFDKHIYFNDYKYFSKNIGKLSNTTAQKDQKKKIIELKNEKIIGIYSGLDNVGMKSTIILRGNGKLVIQASIGNGTPDYGWWLGNAENLLLYQKDHIGNDVLIGRARITPDGLQIIGGRFYRRQ